MKKNSKEEKLHLEIKVEDSGIGIPQEFHNEIFNSFIQVENKENKSAEGTGLGLSITKRLVEMMSGHIIVKSVPDEGSSFIVTLKDVSLADYTGLKSRKDQLVKASFKGKKVLLVDDSGINRRYVKGQFGGIGYVGRRSGEWCIGYE